MINHKILILSGGPSSEYEVSNKTAELVRQNIDKIKYQVSSAIIDKSGRWNFDDTGNVNLSNAIQKLTNYDLVFIAMHGTYGEDGKIQALLDWVGVPYTGSNATSSAVTFDKAVSNIIYQNAGLLVPSYVVFDKNSGNETKQPKITYPAIVKPIYGGSSLGITIIKNADELDRALDLAYKESDLVMVQDYIKGVEVSCGVLEDRNGNPFALIPTQITPRISSFFDYDAKYQKGGSEELTPPNLPVKIIELIQNQSLQAHKALGCDGMSRTDFMVSNEKLFIIETNTIPGMTQMSLLPQGAKAMNISFSKMIDLIIEAGFRKTKNVDTK